MRTGAIERMEPDPTNLHFHEHVARYRFACEHLVPGDILDVASGTGYGSALLAEVSNSTVVGVDRDSETVERATRRFGSQRVRFVQADACELPFDDDQFASVVSLETLAFIENDHGFLREILRVLAPGGVCILSTPDRSYSERHDIHYPYHVREYAEHELADLLRTHFDDVSIYYQGFSNRFRSQVDGYAREIQDRKSDLGVVHRLGIQYIYRPIRDLVPRSVKDVALRRLTGRSYPVPDTRDICISPTPLADASVFIAVLRRNPIR